MVNALKHQEEIARTEKLAKELAELVKQAQEKNIPIERTVDRIAEANQSLSLCVAAIQTNLWIDQYADKEES